MTSPTRAEATRALVWLDEAAQIIGAGIDGRDVSAAALEGLARAEAEGTVPDLVLWLVQFARYGVGVASAADQISAADALASMREILARMLD